MFFLEKIENVFSKKQKLIDSRFAHCLPLPISLCIFFLAVMKLLTLGEITAVK